MSGLRLPAEAPSLADAVVSAVRGGVRDGVLVPEETYSVYRLADELGVSRSPVREGLLRLAEAGLVVFSRNRGFRVVVPTARDVEEIFEIRLALEPPAAREAARTSPAERDGVAAHQDRLEEAAAAGAEERFWACDRALHEALLLATGRPRTATVVEQLRGTTTLLGPPTTTTGRTLDEICAEHTTITAAVVAGEPTAAEAAMRAHLERTCRLLVAGLATPAEPG